MDNARIVSPIAIGLFRLQAEERHSYRKKNRTALGSELLQQFLETYGYFALLLGTLLEGETILALAGYAAYQGWMSFPVVVGIAIVGGFLGDQFFFFLGRRYGDRLLARFPGMAAKAPRVKQLLCRWDAPLVIMIRFMYGLRIAGPIVIGSCGIARWRLALFNFIGALIWAPLVAGVGYVAGHALQQILHDIHRMQAVLMAVLVLALLAIWLIRRR
jgi:membrane protein DedA with SNARE-associated domain